MSNMGRAWRVMTRQVPTKRYRAPEGLRKRAIWSQPVGAPDIKVLRQETATSRDLVWFRHFMDGP